MSVPPWVTTPGPGGLVRVIWAEDDRQRIAVVRVRLAKEGERLEISELHLQDPTPTGLRELRLGAVERLVNLPDIRSTILEHIDEDAPDVFAPFTPTTIKGTAAAWVELERPAHRRLGDDFYRQVGRAYIEAVRNGEPVMRALTEASGAPRNTVARWIKEARRRGYLNVVETPTPGGATAGGIPPTEVIGYLGKTPGKGKRGEQRGGK